MQNNVKPSLSADSTTCDLLARHLADVGLDTICNLAPVTDAISDISLDDRKFSRPIRLGMLLDILQNLKHNQSTKTSVLSTMEFNGGTLDLLQSNFIKNTNGANIRLTEKEIDILTFLYNNKEKIISREELLNAVWGYAKNVETHTLETHIYRLRQKIEDDPSNPQTLITEETGYTVQPRHFSS